MSRRRLSRHRRRSVLVAQYERAKACGVGCQLFVAELVPLIPKKLSGLVIRNEMKVRVRKTAAKRDETDRCFPRRVEETRSKSPRNAKDLLVLIERQFVKLANVAFRNDHAMA